jgi:glycosyltransferase involved in cell wall biosynthesis
MSSRVPFPGNILLVANYASDVGYAWWLMESFWSAIAHHYAATGSKIFLAAPRVNGISDTIKRAPIHVSQLDFSNRDRSNRRLLKDYIRENEIRVMYLTDQPYLDFQYAALRRWGIRWIINHDHTPGERPPVRSLRGIVKRTLYGLRAVSCDHYIAVSDFVHSRLRRNACVPADRCSTVLNGIVPIEPDPTCRERIRAEFDIPGDAHVVVTTGRASYYKGIDFLIDCASLLRKRGHLGSTYFLYCGDGPDLKAFQTKAADLGIADRFIFAGRRDDVRCVLQACDIAVQMSLGEAFSLSILEYMSAGLATVAPAMCGNGEAIRHGVDGMLYSSRDREGLATMLAQLTTDSDLRIRLGREAVRTVCTRFTLDRANADLVRTLEAALTR